MRAFKIINNYLKSSYEFFINHKLALSSMWGIFLCSDLINFYIQTRLGLGAEKSRTVEIIYQIFIVYLSVVFIHFVNSLKREDDLSIFSLFTEALLLSLGFVLQSIFYLLSIIGGGVLLVIPGLYCALFLYLAPIVAVLRPDYDGKTFFYAHDLVKNDRLEAASVIIFCFVMPFIPEGLNLLLTGSVRSDWSILVSPIDNFFYLATQLILVLFTLDKIEAFRPVEMNTEIKKGLHEEGQV